MPLSTFRNVPVMWWLQIATQMRFDRRATSARQRFSDVARRKRLGGGVKPRNWNSGRESPVVRWSLCEAPEADAWYCKFVIYTLSLLLAPKESNFTRTNVYRAMT